jgi:galactokinase
VPGTPAPEEFRLVDTAALRKQFIERYGHRPEPLRLFFAPGRINLIGGHTDYTGGLVLPCAITLGTLAAARRTTANHMALASLDEPFSCTVPLDRPLAPQGKHWVNYPLGVAQQFIHRGISLPGAELLFFGNLPWEAGLSSSASLELAAAAALDSLACANLEMEELVRMARAAENTFVGLECGIMDQFASGMGRKGCALLLNCATLQHRQVPLPLDGHRLVIADTRKPRGLAASKYNERVAECREVEQSLLGVLEAPSLSRLTPGRLEENIHRIPTETLRRRARHVVRENNRVMQAVQALIEGDLPAFGALMFASHDSLRDDYQVSCPELDTLVDAARMSKGVLGARMMGGGFGGCTITLVREDAAETFISSAGETYRRATSLTAKFHYADTGDGAREMEQ